MLKKLGPPRAQAHGTTEDGGKGKTRLTISAIILMMALFLVAGGALAANPSIDENDTAILGGVAYGDLIVMGTSLNTDATIKGSMAAMTSQKEGGAMESNLITAEDISKDGPDMHSLAALTGLENMDNGIAATLTEPRGGAVGKMIVSSNAAISHAAGAGSEANLKV
ncbi:MAG: hypothetical protein OEL89_02455 [Candidatus Peregrinibacteria bacterium]|nr:hypothetical protein [Candidatus Peregrinibacteria bacterium]